MSKIYGIATFSGPTSLTGAICNDFTITANTEKKELAGNPASEIVDVRAGKVTETMTVNCAFSGYVEPKELIGNTVTLSVSSDDTSPATASVAGVVVAAECRGSKDDWWIYSITVQYVGS